jgi:2,3-bisphosphoglycerate-dependent phosphoglycerate mutase
MKTYLYFIRHASSPFSLENERTRVLSEQGKTDAERIVEILKNEGIDFIGSSSYTRAIDTVKPLAKHPNMEITYLEELIERPIAS